MFIKDLEDLELYLFVNIGTSIKHWKIYSVKILKIREELKKILNIYLLKI